MYISTSSGNGGTWYGCDCEEWLCCWVFRCLHGWRCLWILLITPVPNISNHNSIIMTDVSSSSPDKNQVWRTWMRRHVVTWHDVMWRDYMRRILILLIVNFYNVYNDVPEHSKMGLWQELLSGDFGGTMMWWCASDYCLWVPKKWLMFLWVIVLTPGLALVYGYVGNWWLSWCLAGKC